MQNPDACCGRRPFDPRCRLLTDPLKVVEIAAPRRFFDKEGGALEIGSLGQISVRANRVVA